MCEGGERKRRSSGRRGEWGGAVGRSIGGGNGWEGGQKPRMESVPEGGSGKPHHAYGDKAASGTLDPTLCV